MWKKQAGAELGQAQLKLELFFTSTKIWGIANCYILLDMISLCKELTIGWVVIIRIKANSVRPD